MALNTAIFTGRTGMLRIVTLILGVITLGIAADKYFKYAKEEFFLSMVIICFIISVIWVVLVVLEVITSSDNLKKADVAYHVIGGLLLIISAIVWLVSVFDIGDFCGIFQKSSCTGTYILRIFAGILGILNGVVYVFLGYTLHSTSAAAQ